MIGGRVVGSRLHRPYDAKHGKDQYATGPYVNLTLYLAK